MQPAVSIQNKAAGAKVRLSVTARHGFVAPPGYVLLSVDFSSQELYVAAVLSGDQTMLHTFTQPEILPLLDSQNNPVLNDEGKEIFFANPDADLHTITCKNACFPHLFVDKEKHELVSIAKDESLITLKGDPRFYAKRLNFGINYGQSPPAMSKLFHVKEEITKEWVKGHQRTYSRFHEWSAEVGHLSAVRGWSRNPDNLIRWVAEDNAKEAGSSPERSGVNFQIQGFSSSQVKLAQKKVFQSYKGSKCKLGMIVHDELVSAIPGSLVLNETKCKLKNGIFVPFYEPDEEAKYWSDLTKKQMEDAQTETFDWKWQGRSSASVSAFWAH